MALVMPDGKLACVPVETARVPFEQETILHNGYNINMPTEIKTLIVGDFKPYNDYPAGLKRQPQTLPAIPQNGFSN